MSPIRMHVLEDQDTLAEIRGILGHHRHRLQQINIELDEVYPPKYQYDYHKPKERTAYLLYWDLVDHLREQKIESLDAIEHYTHMQTKIRHRITWLTI